MTESKLQPEYNVIFLNEKFKDPEAKYYVLRYDHKASSNFGRLILINYAEEIENQELLSDLMLEQELWMANDI